MFDTLDEITTPDEPIPGGRGVTGEREPRATWIGRVTVPRGTLVGAR